MIYPYRSYCSPYIPPLSGSELLQDKFPFSVALSGDPGSHAEALVSNLLGVSCWILVARALYLKKVFINI